LSEPVLGRARAKINLTLHVLGRRPDGYHRLESLVAFAAVGDELRFVPGGATFSLTITGAMAKGLATEPDNLVLRAARGFQARFGGPAGAFTLVKRLPVASGIGGGSSDAATALRLLATVTGTALDHPDLHALALSLGADVPVCLSPATRMMSGIGETLGPALALPRLPALLVNPGVATPTAQVFQTLGLLPGADYREGGEPPGDGLSRSALVAHLAAARNDLEAPATRCVPVIAEALAALRNTTGCRLARMSGSGATVYGLYDTCRASAAAAAHIRARHPSWWIKPTMIGGA
jgi:4-diphosphocytidyl-2-C-methyl-D-erythritol kinase